MESNPDMRGVIEVVDTYFLKIAFVDNEVEDTLGNTAVWVAKAALAGVEIDKK